MTVYIPIIDEHAIILIKSLSGGSGICFAMYIRMVSTNEEGHQNGYNSLQLLLHSLVSDFRFDQNEQMLLVLDRM